MNSVLNRLKLKYSLDLVLHAFVLMFIIGTGFSFAHAGQKCDDSAKKSSDACNGHSSGCPDQQSAMDAAAAQVSADNGTTAGIGATSAQQCTAQQTRSNDLSSLSNLTAQCCTSASNKCKQDCDSDKQGVDKNDKTKQAQDDSKKSQCQTDSQNAATASAQGAQQAAAAGGNAACAAASSNAALPALPAAPAASTTTPDTPTLPTPPPTPVVCPSGQQADQNNNCVAINQLASGAQLAGPGTPNAPGIGSSPGIGSTTLSNGSASSGAAAASGGGGSSGGSGGGIAGGEAAAALKISQKKEAEQKALLAKLSGGDGGGGGGGNYGSHYDSDGSLSPFKLPSSLGKKAGLAGMTLKPIDGITGPTDASLFEKVSKQYQRQKPKLFTD